MVVKNVLLFGMMVFLFVGCVRHAPTTQLVCTRPLVNEKRAIVTVAPVMVGGEASERFAGVIEAVVQTWLRGKGAHTVEDPPYDFHVFGQVSMSGDAPLGVATVTLKMVTAGNEVVANGAGTAVYNGGARDGFHSDMQAVGRAAQIAAEGFCMTREREYVYPAAPQTTPPPPATSPHLYEGYAYGYMEMYPYAPPVYGGSVFIHGRARGGTISLPLPLPLLIYKAIKGDSGEERHRHGGRHHRVRHRLGGHPRR